MICPACQHENPAEANFCQECGTRFSTGCPQCGTDLPLAAKFCHECGRSTIEAQPERDPRDYTPKHLADKILQSRSALEGERKQVTVLFADVKGSVKLSGQLDHEEWHHSDRAALC